MSKPIPRALTVAGSDSGGCAGIQADLKTFAALGVHGMTAVTSITAQDTCRVHAVHDLPPAIVKAQIDAVIEDIGVDAVKTGMLSSSEIIEAVAEALGRHGVANLVVDPVMVSTGGDLLIRPSAVDTLRRKMFPLATLVTPNWAEARHLSGEDLGDLASCRRAAAHFLKWGASAVLIKGGHDPDHSGQATDTYFEEGREETFSAPRLDTENTHGSGCTLAAAIAARLACGDALTEAVRAAKSYLTEALSRSYSVGRGRGPLGHFERP